ncbi:MAG: hypothetical protein KKD44_27040 [Proteobacteria bacterium]|nr:hypothetical protein [Pseudomonadota bacterium]
MNKVYIRDFATRSVVKEFDVSSIAGTSNYDRFVRGLMTNMDLDKYYLDDSEYQEQQTRTTGKE